MTPNRTPLLWPITWILTWAARVVIKGYQWFISPVLPGSCRFYPICSSYALEAVNRHGPIKGSWLGLKRIARCHPWNDGGYDPVPDAEHHHSDHGPCDCATHKH